MNESFELKPDGDMSPAEFRAAGYQVIDWIANYLEKIETYPVLSRVKPGDIVRTQAPNPPAHPEDFERIMADFRADVIPGITHWNHPGFFGYFPISGSGPGILGEALTAALNVNGMLWRTSPAATELENVSLGWLRQMVGLPDIFSGHIQDTASTSTMVAIAAAREASGLDVRREGLAGRDLPRLRIYCSKEAHSSVDKAAITLGLGLAGVTRIVTDKDFRMDSGALASAIDSDLAEGVRPLCVVATAGTTSTTSVDPLEEVADICADHAVWMHVDAAYGGAAAVLPEVRPLFSGWERADSIVMNPHKWLFVPVDCSVLYLRDPSIAQRTYSLVPDYLTTPEGATVTNLMELGPALGRRFRALKLWMTIRYFGLAGIAGSIREHLRLASLLAGLVSHEDGWELLAPVPLSTVCFRYRPTGLESQSVDELNERILERVNATGEVFLSHTRLRGSFAMRLAVGNIRTQEHHVRRAWDLLRAAANEG